MAAAQIFPNGLVRVARNRVAGVDANGNPVRYQWGACDGMRNEWMIDFINLGGTAEAFMAFVPFFRGRGLFLLPSLRSIK